MGDFKRSVTTWFPLLTYSVPFLRDCVIVIVCLAIYRTARLTVLPWLAAQFAVAFVGGSISSYYFHQLLPPNIPEHLPPTPALSLALFSSLSADLSAFLAAMLVMSEVAVLICRAYSDVRSTIVRFLVSIPRHTVAISMAAIVLAVLEPLLPVIYYYSHPRR